MTTIALLVISLLQQQVAAQPVSLQMSIRMSIEKVDMPAASSQFGGFGALLARMLTPEGPVDINYKVSVDGMRAEVNGRLASLPAGTVLLQRTGETILRVLNPVQKTWYELPQAQNPAALLGTPDVSIQPTGERAEIAGQYAERFTFTERVQVPVAPGMNVPPDFPHDITFRGELWSTDAFAGDAYKPVFRTLQTFAAVPGMDALTANGRFPLRLHLQSDLMPGYEVRTEVTSVKTGTADPSLFTIPSDYQKILPPVGR